MANTKQNAKTLTVEVHSTEKTAKATGNKFRSYFATAVGGEDLDKPMSVIFCGNSGGKPRAEHAILTIDPLVSSSYGREKNSGKTAIFISDPYSEQKIEPRKKGTPFASPRNGRTETRPPRAEKMTKGSRVKSSSRKSTPPSNSPFDPLEYLYYDP